MREGLELAGGLGLDVYVLATPSSLPWYRQFGFEEVCSKTIAVEAFRRGRESEDDTSTENYTGTMLRYDTGSKSGL